MRRSRGCRRDLVLGALARVLGVALATGLPGAALAQDSAAQDSAAPPPPASEPAPGSADTVDVAELERRIEAITRELEEMRLGKEVVVQADTSLQGLGPAASKVYRVPHGVSIGGYGEMLYENFASDRQDESPSGEDDRIDMLRAVLYTGYKFNDRLLFNSEVEFEHASTEAAGAVSVEFAYLEYRFDERLGIRGGLVLAPMGFLNELHEPPTFLGTERPEVEREIIPSTWRENGVGLFGDAGGWSYRAYVINGFKAAGDPSGDELDSQVGGGGEEGAGFTGDGLAGGRQNGSEAVAESFAGVGRLEYVGFPGLRAGGSLYLGDSGQGLEDPARPGRALGVRTLIYEGHAEYRAYGLDLRALVAVADVDDVAALNEALGLEGDESVGERLVGWYLQGGYDVIRGLGTEHQVIPFFRYEKLNTQDQVPAGFFANPDTDRSTLSIGVAWKPIQNVAVKSDYNVHRNEAETGVNQLNAVISYLF